MKRFWHGWIWAILLTGSSVVASDSRPNEAAAPRQLLRHVVLIGASATAGFKTFGSTNRAEGGFFALRPYVEAALQLPHEPVVSLGNVLFVLAPTPMAKGQIQNAKATNASVVVGIDFLFWHCYGDFRTEEERLTQVEKALRLLGTLECPVLIGTIPDASAAANGILRPAQIPQAETLERANKRIEEWANARRGTKVVDLAKFMGRVIKNQPIRIHGQTIAESRTLLQEDRLHPTPAGAAALALLILEKLLEDGPNAARGGICWDLEEVRAAAGSEIEREIAKQRAAVAAEKPARDGQ